MSFRRHVAIALACYAAIAVFAAASAGLLWRSIEQQTERVTRSRDAVVTALAIQTALLDQETGQRGFVITGEQSFLEPYRDGYEAEQSSRAELDALIDGNDDLEAQAAAARVAADQWRAEAAEPEIQLRRVDEDAVIELIAEGGGKQYFDASRDAQTTLVERLTAREQTTTDELYRIRGWFAAVLFAAIAATVVVTVATFLLFRRRLIGPLDRLTEAVEAVGGGDLDGAIPVEGTQEMQRVAASVDSMRRNIVSLLSASVRQREAIEQEAIVTSQLAGSLTSVPRTLPDGWTMDTHQQAAEGLVAGDCLSVDLLSPTTFSIVMLDISGHGASAALQAWKAMNVIGAGLRRGAEPHEALELLSTAWNEDRFVSAFVAVADTASGRLQWANAGHPAAMLRNGDETMFLGATGPVVYPSFRGWHTRDAVMWPGDFMVIATDGVAEARRSDREFYGEERLEGLVRESTSDDVMARLLDDVEQFLGGHATRDDVTVAVVRRPPRP